MTPSGPQFIMAVKLRRVYTFHITIHAAAAGLEPGTTIDLAGHEYRPLSISPSDLTAPLPATFDDCIDSLARLPQMFCEPDGSLVWTSPPQADRWLVDGQLSENEGRLHTVELKGTCPAEAFDQLLAALGPPGTSLVFQLMREGIYLDEAEFRRWASPL